MRHRIRAGRISIMALGLTGLLMAASSPASANAMLVGQVINSSSWGMHITYSLGQGADRCDVWNYSGGTTPDWVYAPCKQVSLPAHSTSDYSKDADAFTFNNDDYMLNFKGTQSWRTKGVWTKINSWQAAKCTVHADFGVPYCVVTG
ncbi:hypothetical protein ACIBIZ_39115 [Nonomuraea spiralis]|uniref:hypothetical protein n=1 Tax=Nonomuraea TaxID=83681 RepID=UPI000F79E116|nr:hypothetical protein [Nonomuraea sp. WAC 01424]GGT19860.1 hypothetical protein GCM10010176_075500 [Nonomuraea spiralis]